MQTPLRTGDLTDTVTDSLKVPPHSIEAEQAVLGGLMLDNEAWLLIAERVGEQDFYRNDHRLIFRAIGSLANDGKTLRVLRVTPHRRVCSSVG